MRTIIVPAAIFVHSLNWMVVCPQQLVYAAVLLLLCVRTISINISSFRPADGYLKPLSKSFARCVSETFTQLKLVWSPLDWFPFIYGQDHQLGRYDYDDDRLGTDCPTRDGLIIFIAYLCKIYKNFIFFFYILCNWTCHERVFVRSVGVSVCTNRVPAMPLHNVIIWVHIYEWNFHFLNKSSREYLNILYTDWCYVACSAAKMCVEKVVAHQFST